MIGFGGLKVTYSDESSEVVTTTVGDLARIGQRFGPDWRTQLEAGKLDQLDLATYMAWLAVRRGPHHRDISHEAFLDVVAEIAPSGGEEGPRPTVGGPGSEPVSKSPLPPVPPPQNGSTLTPVGSSPPWPS